MMLLFQASFDVWSGWFADVFGRKNSLTIGSCLLVVTYAVGGRATSFWPFALMFCLMGLGYSFISGADKALAYDSLACVNQQSQYPAFLGSMALYRSIGGCLAYAIGSLIAASWGIRLTIWLQIPICGLMVAVCLAIREAPGWVRSRRTFGDALRDVLAALRFALVEEKTIRWTIAHFAALCCIVDVFLWLRPIYLQHVGLPLGWFGAVYSVYMLLIGPLAKYVKRYDGVDVKYVLVWIMIVCLVSSMIFASMNLVAIIAFVGFLLATSSSWTLIDGYVNSKLRPGHRATALSIKSSISQISFVATSPGVGWLIRQYSPSVAIIVSAVVYSAVMGIGVLGMYRLDQAK